ncbi:MAG: cytochrome c biogenesis protein CcsA [Bryobacterales bacterium]|nr:cytochrome c biogenesis protein CcsA [Bryobacterales bacterium]
MSSSTMQELSIFWLRVATALYAVGLFHALITVLRRESTFFRPALAAFVVGSILHWVSIIDRWFTVGHLPVDNFFESVSLCAFLMALVYLYSYWRHEFASLAVLAFPLVFIMALLAATETPVAGWADTRVRGAWLLVHVTLVMVGYAALFLTAGASVFYLVEERRLKRKELGGFKRLPPLGTLDEMITRSMGIGFALLTLATVAGATWAYVESGTRWIGDAKIAISLLTWALCLVMVFLRNSAGWRGRKAALMSLTVLGASALTWAAHVGLRPALMK